MRKNLALEQLNPYKGAPPLEQIRQHYGLDRVVKLASNECPEQPFPEVIEAIEAAASGLNRYPDGGWRDLREALGEHWSVDPASVVLGNGSCDLLLALARATLMPGTEFVFPWPSFVIYRTMAEGALAVQVPVPLVDFKHDLRAMEAAVNDNTHLVVICNPNNPTGTYLQAKEVRRFIEAMPADLTVALDEAYIEYVETEDEDTTQWIYEFPNLVIFRTFSKVYGLAGLRVGYALADEPLVTALNKMRQPFNLNTLAQVAAAEALRHKERLQERTHRVWRERDRIEDELGGMGLQPVPTEANFIVFHADGLTVPPEEAAQALMERGVLIRSGYALGMPGYLRVTVGTAEENRLFLDTIGQFLPAPIDAGAASEGEGLEEDAPTMKDEAQRLQGV